MALLSANELARTRALRSLALAVPDPLPGLQEAGGVSRAMTLGDAFGAAAREIWIGPVYLGR